jgi:sortase (surface protein transpeptidase)
MIFRIFLLYFNKSLKIAKANEKKDRQFFGQRKRQTLIYETLHRKLTIEQHEPHKKPRENSGAQEGLSIPVALMKPIVLLGTNPVMIH